MFLSEVLDPYHVEEFKEKYLNKDICVWNAPIGATDRYKPLYSWEKFESFLNNYDQIKNIQIAGIGMDGEPDNGAHKWDKGRGCKLTRDDIHFMWRAGHSIVLPFCEYQSRHLWSIVRAFEHQFGSGQCNMYCSPGDNSFTFNPHVDGTDNFLFHIEGYVRWDFYKEVNGVKKRVKSMTLGAGDLLYIPIGLYHKTTPLTPRLTASIHFDSKNKNINRPKMKDWYRWFEYQRTIKL
jgi:mannose-6-phosphate isomerase-like protein (cupin superfamily)